MIRPQVQFPKTGRTPAVKGSPGENHNEFN